MSHGVDNLESKRRVGEPTGANKLAYTFREFKALEIPPKEEIIHALARRELAIAVAEAGVGKSSLFRNLAISEAVGKEFHPFTKEAKPKKVAFLDFEEDKSSFRDDLLVMRNYLSNEQKEHLHDNLLLLCDMQDSNGDSIKLSRASDFDAILESLSDFGPDLVIIDTLSAGFEMDDENDNGKVMSRILDPLTKLAKAANSAVIILHHPGKGGNNEYKPSRQSPTYARGASSLGNLPRVCLNLYAEADGTVVLRLGKKKGGEFPEETRFRLDSETRWFSPVIRTPGRAKTSERDLAKFLDSLDFDREYRKQEIKHILPTGSASTFDRKLKRCVDEGLLIQLRHGYYAKPHHVSDL